MNEWQCMERNINRGPDNCLTWVKLSAKETDDQWRHQFRKIH